MRHWGLRLAAGVLVVALAACGSGKKDPQALARQISDETAGAMWNAGLSGVIEKGQSVSLDAAMNLNVSSIGCVREQGKIPQIEDCGPDSGWAGITATMPLARLEPLSVTLVRPDPGRGQSGLGVSVSCDKQMPKCVLVTGRADRTANYTLRCKTQDGCRTVIQDLVRLITLAKPAGVAPLATDSEAGKLAARIDGVYDGSEFNFGTEAPMVERGQRFWIGQDWAARAEARMCTGADGQVISEDQCGPDDAWMGFRATFAVKDIDPATIRVVGASQDHQQQGVLLHAACWAYATTCVHMTSPLSDQQQIELECKSQPDCAAAAAALRQVTAQARQHSWDAAGGKAAILARMDAATHGAGAAIPAAGAETRGVSITQDAPGELTFKDRMCQTDSWTGVNPCTNHPELWTNTTTTAELKDLDPALVDLTGRRPDQLAWYINVQCRKEAGNCLKQAWTGADASHGTTWKTMIACQDIPTCEQMSADLVSLIMAASPQKAP